MVTQEKTFKNTLLAHENKSSCVLSFSKHSAPDKRNAFLLLGDVFINEIYKINLYIKLGFGELGLIWI